MSGIPQLPLASSSVVHALSRAPSIGTGRCLSHGGCDDDIDVGVACRVVARRLRASLFRGTESARNDNGDAATQPLSGQPTIRPAAPSRYRRHPRMHPHRVGDYRGWGCVYRHAADKLVGVSAGGITLSGKKHPVSLPLPSSPLSLYLRLPVPKGGKPRGGGTGADVP